MSDLDQELPEGITIEAVEPEEGSGKGLRSMPDVQRVVIHPTWRAQLFTLIGYLILFWVTIIVSNLEEDVFVIEGNLFNIFGYELVLHFPWLSMINLAVLFKLLFFMYNAKYLVDDQGVEAQIGLWSNNLRQPRLRYEDIRGVEPKQTILERILGIGTLMVGSAMTFEVEIEMSGIANPRAIQHLINVERDKQLKALKQSGSASGGINSD